jgi:phosphoribosylpyrophosphate synthetase
LEIVIPYFPVGTMERVQQEWEIATAKVLMRILSSTPPARSGQTLFHIFDIHDVHERFYGSDNILIRLTTLTELIKIQLKSVPNLAIAFPDEWAYKRFKWDFEGYDTIICSKIRDWDRRIVRIQEWDVVWKNIVIVDDLIQTWGTLIEAAKAIRAAGAASVSAYASHGVFPEESHIKLASVLDTLYVTDSIPDNIARAKNIPNVKVLEIHSHIEKILY